MIVILREPGGLAEFMTLNPDYTTGASGMTFAPDAKVAFGFARVVDAEQFLKRFRGLMPSGVKVGEIK